MTSAEEIFGTNTKEESKESEGDAGSLKKLNLSECDIDSRNKKTIIL